MKESQKAVQESLAASTTIAQRVLSNLTTFRILGAEARQLSGYETAVRESLGHAQRVGKDQAMYGTVRDHPITQSSNHPSKNRPRRSPTPTIQHPSSLTIAQDASVAFAMNSSLCLVFAFGGQQVLDGNISAGGLSSFLMYVLGKSLK